MRIVIDRIENGIAVCEVLSCEVLSQACYSRREFSLNELPDGVREGDVLDFKDNKFTPNPEAARERQNHIKNLMNDVFIPDKTETGNRKSSN